MNQLVSLLGLFVMLGIAFVFSKNKKKIDRKTVLIGVGFQLVLALLVLGIPSLGIEGPLRFLFSAANIGIVKVLSLTEEGSRFLFGDLLNVEKSGFIVALQILPTIVFMASLMQVFYYLGVMQKIVMAFAYVMQKALKISGAESLSVAANVFVGQTEAPLLIKPYIKGMTQSELLAVMTGGMATVAGGVMAAYVGLLRDKIPDIAGHLMTASVLSAPAAIIIAKILMPETQTPETLGTVPKDSMVSEDSNIIEAAANGATEGMKLALNVGAMLLAFIALIAGLDAILKYFGELINFAQWGQDFVPALLKKEGPVELSFSLIIGWFFAPLAWVMGIPWNEAAVAGSLLGQKIVMNEFVAYLNLSTIMSELSDRTVIILSYALCGFANFSSIAIQIGGIGGIAPDRKTDLARLGIYSVIGGSLAAFMTATLAGLLI